MFDCELKVKQRGWQIVTLWLRLTTFFLGARFVEKRFMTWRVHGVGSDLSISPKLKGRLDFWYMYIELSQRVHPLVSLSPCSF